MLLNKWIASLALVAASTGMVCAQEPALGKAQNTTPAGKLDSKTSGIGVRASKLIGMKLQNSKKENVGQIKDIVLDPVATRIQYVAVTYGGFLGLGDKLFAVPMQAIKVEMEPNSDRIVLVLDVTKEQMNGAVGFDENHWPNFSDTSFTDDLHRRYGVEDRWNHEAHRNGNVDVRVGREGVKVDVGNKK